jgi:putative DNA primase/helicase
MSNSLYQTYPETEDMLMQAAIAYARQGVEVFPLYGIDDMGRCDCGDASCKHPGKHPNGRLVPNGMNSATMDVAQIVVWWTKFPNSNIGTITGERVNRLVIDVDARAGGWETADRIEEQHGPFPPTICVNTGGGGLHIHQQFPKGLDIRNSAGLLGPGIDVRANGGSAVLPPSMHASGRRYAWSYIVDDDSDEEPARLAPPPRWLIQLLTAPSQPRASFPENRSPRSFHLGEAGRGNDEEVFREGGRNAALASKAGAMRRAGFSQAEILTALLKLNADRCSPPLAEKEVAMISRSIARYAPAPRPILRGGTGARPIRVMNGRVA